MHHFLVLLTRAIMAFGLYTCSLEANEHPNVLLILADDLGWSDTTLYGTTKLYQTPNIQRLAARGMTFTRAYSASPLCSPTRSAILTGLSPARTGITTPNCHLPQVVLEATPGKSAPPNQHSIQPSPVTRLKTDYPTLPKALKAAGYATGHFGKWHLGPEPYSPLEHGFDVDIPHWPGPGPAGSFVAPWKFPDFKEKSPGEHLEDRMAAEAVAWMEQNKDRPFFLNYWQFSVHAPFDAKRALIEKYRPLVNPADPQRSPTYAAMIESFDDAIGTLLDALDRLQLADKTIILFTSDNGGNMYNEVDGTTPTSNAPLRGGKATMFEGGVRVPQIIAWPGITQPGSRSDALTQSEDFFPTLIDGLGLQSSHHSPSDEKLPKINPSSSSIQTHGPSPEAMTATQALSSAAMTVTQGSSRGAMTSTFDGISILPALKGQALDRQAVFQYFPHNPGVPDWLPPSVSVHRSDGWKLIRLFHAGKSGAHRHLLFNLNEDQGEKSNLAAQQPALVKELDALIDTFLADTKAVLPIPNPAFDPAKYRPELEGVQTNKKGAKGKANAKAAPASPQAAKPRQAATFRVFAGGVAGVEDLANAEHSARFRAAGGGLYLHNNGWAALNPEQQRQVLAVFKDRPIAIELGFNPGAEAWAQRYRTGYAPHGMKPEFICANAFDQNNRPTPEQWTHYMRTLRETGGVPQETLILPTFEYANFAPNIATLAENKVSQRADFQAIIRTAGGITLDTPPGYFFSREQNYRDWIVDAIRWTRAAGLRVIHIVSPHRSGEQFNEDTEKILAHLREHDALPDTFVSENYEAAPPPGYPNRVGPESLPHTALGVALHLIEQNQLAAWEASKDAVLAIKDGALVITATGKDPWISTRDLPANVKGPFTLKLRLSSTAAGPGLVYYATPQHPVFQRDRSVSFDLIHDGQLRVYEMGLSVETLSALRLDPGNASGRIVIQDIQLHQGSGLLWRFPAGDEFDSRAMPDAIQSSNRPSSPAPRR